MKPSLLPRHFCRQRSIYTPSRLSQPLHQRPQWRPRPTFAINNVNTPSFIPRRSFNLSSLSSFLPSGPNNNNNNSGRTLTASRTLPYAPQGLYKVISSVESYSQFLPFLTASTVTARDLKTNHPTRAFLTVGYGPLSETFTSQVDCDPENWVVEARSGAKFGIDSKKGQEGLDFPGANEGIFEYLSTRWQLVPMGEKGTRVELEIRFEFRNQLHAMMMSAVEGQMAGTMIEAFEKRIREEQGGR